MYASPVPGPPEPPMEDQGRAPSSCPRVRYGRFLRPFTSRARVSSHRHNMWTCYGHCNNSAVNIGGCYI